MLLIYLDQSEFKLPLKPTIELNNGWKLLSYLMLNSSLGVSRHISTADLSFLLKEACDIKLTETNGIYR